MTILSMAFLKKSKKIKIFAEILELFAAQIRLGKLTYQAILQLQSGVFSRHLRKFRIPMYSLPITPPRCYFPSLWGGGIEFKELP